MGRSLQRDYDRLMDVLIYGGAADNWKLFAAWYSFQFADENRNVSLVCYSDENVQFELLQWAKRLKVRHWFLHENPDPLELAYAYLDRQPQAGHVLVVDCTVMQVLPWAEDVTQVYRWCKHGLLLKGDRQAAGDLLNRRLLLGEVLAEDVFIHEARQAVGDCSLASYQGGCGKWDGRHRACPFHNASAWEDTGMNITEMRIIDLWRRMNNLFEALH